MSAPVVLGVLAAMSGGLPELRLKRRRRRKPDAAAEARAEAKRARRAAAFADGMRRTAAGRERKDGGT